MDKAHGYADKTIEEIEKELKEIYATAQKELAKKAEAYMNKFIAEDEKQRKLLDTGKLTEKEYQQWLKKKVMSGQRFTKMKEQCAEQLTHANEIALDHINDRMADVYAVSYNALEKDVKGISGYSFHIVSPDTVKTLAGRDSSLLPYKKLDPAKDIPWNMKAINSEVLQGVLQGESVKAITKRVFGYTTQSGKDQAEIAHKMQVAAARTAQTLITAAENKGRQDSYDRAAKDGVIIEKEWIATLDHATRDSHRELHKTTVPENQPFDNGLMYPGDPSGAPEEVYNCRCTMAAVVKGFTPAQKTKSESEDTAFSYAKTTEEAEAYAERFVTQLKSQNTGKYSSGVIDYKGVNVEYANEMNRAMTEIFDAYQPDAVLQNIKPMNKRESKFSGSSAEAAYEWGTNNLYYNKDNIKSEKAYNDHKKEHDELLSTVTNGADDLLETATGAKRQYLQGIKESGRAVVYSTDIYGATIHEMGHFLDDEVFSKAYMVEKEIKYPTGYIGKRKESAINFKESMDKYSTKISAYATTSQKEYMAESFAAYWKGEKDIIDPELVEIFERAKKK